MKSAIIASNFESPKSLGEYLSELNKNDSEYDSFRAHKINGIVSNELLLQTFKKDLNEDNEPNWAKYVNNFECFVCRATYNESFFNTVSKNVYDCPKFVSVVNNKPNKTNWWHSDWHMVKCEAFSLRKLIDENISDIIEEELDNLTMKNYLNLNC